MKMTSPPEDADCCRILKTTSKVTLNFYEASTFYLHFPVVKNKKEFGSQRWKFFWYPRQGEWGDERWCHFMMLKGECPDSRNVKSYFHVKLYKSNDELLLTSSNKVKSYMPAPHYNSLVINWNQRLDSELREELKSVVYLHVTLCSDPDSSPKSFEATKRMLDEGIMTDFTIKTKGKDFPCHKFMLAAESEYFRAMFEADMREKGENSVNWVDVADEDTVQDMLHYIYAGERPPKLKETCLALMEVASMCLMEDVKRLCAVHISETLSVENMADVLRLAAKLECNQLHGMVVNFIVDNYDLNDESPPPWDSLEPEFAKTLLSSVLRIMVAKKLYI